MVFRAADARATEYRARFAGLKTSARRSGG